MPTGKPTSTDTSPTATPNNTEAAPKAERPMRADARRNRAKVLDVAQQMFFAEGMSVPIDAIAERAGVGVGTVYRHFPTKEALFEAIMTRRIEWLVNHAEELADAPDPGAAFFSYFADVAEQTEASKGLQEALIESGIKLDAAFGDLGRRMMVALDVLLTQAKQAGTVRTDVTASDVKALITGVTAMRQQGGDPKLTLDVVLAGLRPVRD